MKYLEERQVRRVSFIHSFDKYSLSTYYILDKALRSDSEKKDPAAFLGSQIVLNDHTM